MRIGLNEFVEKIMNFEEELRMMCVFCGEEFDARFNVGDAYEGLKE